MVEGGEKKRKEVIGEMNLGFEALGGFKRN
jgi:hypothetical protein